MRLMLLSIGVFFAVCSSLSVFAADDYGLSFIDGAIGTVSNGAGELSIRVYNFSADSRYHPATSSTAEYYDSKEYTLFFIGEKAYWSSSRIFPLLLKEDPSIPLQRAGKSEVSENGMVEYLISYTTPSPGKISSIEWGMVPEKYLNGIPKKETKTYTSFGKLPDGTIPADSVPKEVTQTVTYLVYDVCYDTSKSTPSRTENCQFLSASNVIPLSNFQSADKELILEKIKEEIDYQKKKGENEFPAPLSDSYAVTVEEAVAIENPYVNPSTPTPKPIESTVDGRGYVTVSSDGTKVIMASATTSVETKLSVKVSDATLEVNDTPLTILPSDLEKKAIPSLDGATIKRVELVMNGQTPAYSIDATRAGKLFFILPIAVPTKITVDAISGQAKETSPWWGFLVGR